MIAKQPAVKRYIVKLGADEREKLNALIQKGKSPARQMLKGRRPVEGRRVGGQSSRRATAR